MNVPIPTVRITPLIAIVAITVMCAAYLVFLYATWNEFQNDRKHRGAVLDDLLDRIPAKVRDEPRSSE